MKTGKIRVLLVDDSGLARAALRAVFESNPDFEVMGEAVNGMEGVAQVRRERPDLITMDLQMPKMDGMAAIEEIMSFRPTPILVVSDSSDAQHAFAAVSHGALDMVAKPGLSEAEITVFLERARVISRIPVITHVKTRRYQPPAPMAASPAESCPAPESIPLQSQHNRVFAIASSTGGPQALAQILGCLPVDFPCPILVAQHVLPDFAAGMAKWLATVSRLPVKLAESGEQIMPGMVYLAPSDVHLCVSQNFRIDLQEISASDVYRPGCDALLASVARAYGRKSVGIILTGMGSDGAKGLAQIKVAGGKTFAQDETSSVVFGMNRVAINSGMVDRVLPLADIAGAMLDLVQP